MEGDPPLTAEEVAAQDAMRVAGGDWGPVFVYGPMLSERVWCALIERVPDMRSAILRGHARFQLQCGPFAAVVEHPGGLVVGSVVSGLKAAERRLLDAVLDDGFVLTSVKVRYLDEMDTDVDCSMYIWRDRFADGLVEDSEWNYEDFCTEYIDQFVEICTDMRKMHEAEKLSDDALKDLALARRRKETGFD
mmetsp:Transcript_64698/g.150453  ORF Transcript_64698/g.150453 Transcript_64698/m.150453 type:complete len:191 (-) Transcript_64698:333-905(-)|eukprot:CAMPEP_0171109702 /NCGR_PEP_ID=MMETSP0766_2-20121228/70931_1 /TAXON_ID=439317 /ORGANISM="Gambierdiscus australes, Strain CAWD 149" /LENGTH=190 /DNA_ID=CAMNT_0011571475 /DNA_START=53 /DNA_END=625 /DNA_ORIENTATION=-